MSQAAELEILRETNVRLGVLAEITNAITTTLDAAEALRRLSRLVVPRLADLCLVAQFHPPDKVACVAVAHRDQDLAPPGKYEGTLPALTEATSGPLAQALRGATARLLDPIPGITEVVGELASQHLAMLAELGAATAIVAPLRGR